MKSAGSPTRGSDGGPIGRSRSLDERGLRRVRLVGGGLNEPPPQAQAHFDKGLSEPAGDHWPFERAQLRLDYGGWLRRQRRINDAKPVLAAALETFRHLGAAPWTRRAEAELRACGVAESAPPAVPETRHRRAPPTPRPHRTGAAALILGVAAERWRGGWGGAAGGPRPNRFLAGRSGMALPRGLVRVTVSVPWYRGVSAGNAARKVGPRWPSTWIWYRTGSSPIAPWWNPPGEPASSESGDRGALRRGRLTAAAVRGRAVRPRTGRWRRAWCRSGGCGC